MAIFVTKAEDVKVFESYTHPASTEPPVEAPAETKAPKAPELQSSVSYNPLASPAPSDSGKLKASPLAKKVAQESGVALESIGSGSGPGGRIIKADVTAAQAKQTTSTTTISSQAFVDHPHTSMRKIIAARLTESKQSIPHYYLRVDVTMDKILELRSKFNSNPALQETFGTFKLSVNDFVVKAAALALKQVPTVNSAWHDGFIREFKSADVCVAVATPAGLITPIVFEADQKGLVAISNSIKELASRAKANKLKPEEFQVILGSLRDNSVF